MKLTAVRPRLALQHIYAAFFPTDLHDAAQSPTISSLQGHPDVSVPHKNTGLSIPCKPHIGTVTIVTSAPI